MARLKMVVCYRPFLAYRRKKRKFHIYCFTEVGHATVPKSHHGFKYA
jgi:hypothetical protein